MHNDPMDSDAQQPGEGDGRSGDGIHRFLFEGLGVRGVLVCLDASWQAVDRVHDYPPAVRALLGQALAAVTLLSATIKYQGSLILQAQGSGPVTTLVTQATHRRHLRGMAHWEGEVAEGSLAAQFGEGRIVITLDPEEGERYQGIVPLGGAGLAEALEGYFAQSEQLPTRLWLVAGARRAAGLLLQVLPGGDPQGEDWGRIGHLAATLREAELLDLTPRELLHRLFHQETLRLFDPEPVAFRCTCTRERVGASLRTLGREDLEDLLREQGAVEVACEFCNRHYTFDAVDVEQLLSDAPGAAPPTMTQ